MSGQESSGTGAEEEFKASLLRQWKEGNLQVAEGRQIPTIIEHRGNLRQRHSWPTLSAHSSLPDLSQPPPGFRYIQAQPSLPLPMPSCLPLPVNVAAPPQPQPGIQYREQVLKALLAGTQLGEVVDALLAVPASVGKVSTGVAAREDSRTADRSAANACSRKPRQNSEGARKRNRDASEGEIILMRESSSSMKHPKILNSRESSETESEDLQERPKNRNLCNRYPNRKAPEKCTSGRHRERSYERFRSSRPRERSRSRKTFETSRSDSGRSPKRSTSLSEGLKIGKPREESRNGKLFERSRGLKRRQRSQSGTPDGRLRSGKEDRSKGGGKHHEKLTKGANTRKRSTSVECQEILSLDQKGRSKKERRQERLIRNQTEEKAKQLRSQISEEIRKEKSFEKLKKDKVDIAVEYRADRKRNYPSTNEVEKESGATMAVVKHLIDAQSGLLELFEGGERRVVLFHQEQVHLDRDSHDMGSRSCNARPTFNSRQLQEALRPGQRVLVLVQRVEAKLVSLQAVVLWLRGCRMPRFSIHQRKLKEQLRQFLVHSSRNVLPLCLDGLPKGEHFKWAAKVKKLVDDEWGLLEVKAIRKEGKLRCFLCIFHKSDVWLSSGVRVPDQRYFRHRSLGEIVAINQPVTLAARSLLKEKGCTMMGALEASVEMQALWVSLNPSIYPQGAARAVRMEKGPGSLGGSKWTPCMFEAGLEERLNKQLRQYVKASGRTLRGLDPGLSRWTEDVRFDLRLKLQGRESRRDRKRERVAEDTISVEDVTIVEDVENNVEDSGDLKLEQKSSNGDEERSGVELKPEMDEVLAYLDLEAGTVLSIINDNFGMIKHSSSGHQVLFDTCDLWVSKESTAAASGKILSSMLKLGDPVKFHAVLVHSSSEPHYLATAVWKMVEGSPIFGDGLAPVAIRRDAIHRDKIEIFKTVTSSPALQQTGAPSLKSLTEVTESKSLKLSEMKILEEVEHARGHLVNILNASFGLIRYGSSFCLFDTYDLFLETGKTAAQSRLTVTNCLTIGMEVNFNGIEMEGGGGVKWLATGVWRPASLEKEPKPVDRQKISPEKMDVFKKVTFMCSELVAHLGSVTDSYPVEMTPVRGEDWSSLHASSEGQSEDSRNEIEKEQAIKAVSLAACSVEIGNGQDICPTSSSLKGPEKTTPEQIAEEILMEVIVAMGERRKEGENLVEAGSFNVGRGVVEDIEQEAVLDQVLSSKFGLVLLQGGETALLKKKRLWVAGGNLPGDWQWEDVKGKRFFCKARKLNLQTQVQYQVTYAYTGIEPSAEGVKPPALVRFVENKEDEEALDRELKKWQELR